MCEGDIKVVESVCRAQRDRMCIRIKIHSTDTDKVGSRRASKSLSDLLDGALPPREKRVDLLPELGGQCCSVLKSLGQMWRLPLVLSQSFIQHSLLRV